MGVSINIHVYDKEKLVTDIANFVLDEGGYRENAQDARSFLEIVGPKFGVLTGDKFYVLWNEYYEEYNPASNFLSTVDKYYFPERDSDEEYHETFWSDHYDSGHGGVLAWDVLEEVFPNDFGEDGKFAPDYDY